MLTQFCKTAAAETASGMDTSTSSAARLWARLLCGLVVITDLFPALRTRFLNQLGNIPSDPNIDRNVSDGDADAVDKDDADGKTATSMSTDEGEAKNGEVPNKQGWGEGEGRGEAYCTRWSMEAGCDKGGGRCKNKGRQTERHPKNKPRGGKCSGKCKCRGKGKCKCNGGGNGKAKAGNTNSDVDDTASAGIMKMLAGSLCMQLGLALLCGLGVKFSDSPRAMYGLPDMYRMLVAMCCGSKESSTAEGQYQENKGPGMVRLPNSSWLLKKLGDVRHDYMLKRCQHMLRRSVLHAKRHGMLRHHIIVAIDEHDIPFHARVMTMKYALFSRSKKGTIKFNRIITVYCVVDGQRITLGAEVVHRKQEQAAVVGRLLKQCRACDIRISAVLMDRGYYSTGVMATVREAGYPMLMPAVKYENIKESIKKFDAGELGTISAHTISSGDQSESFKLIILRRQKVKRDMSAEARALAKLYEQQVRVEDEYYVYAATLPDSWIDGDPKRVAEFYKLRWDIENSYKSYEQLRPWTTSSKHTVRILLWFIPFVLYNRTSSAPP